MGEAQKLSHVLTLNCEMQLCFCPSSKHTSPFTLHRDPWMVCTGQAVEQRAWVLVPPLPFSSCIRPGKVISLMAVNLPLNEGDTSGFLMGLFKDQMR